MLKKISELIAFILTKTLFRSKVKQLEGMIDKDKEKALIESSKKLQASVDKWNMNLEKPEVKRMYKKSGINTEDMHIDKL